MLGRLDAATQKAAAPDETLWQPPQSKAADLNSAAPKHTTPFQTKQPATGIEEHSQRLFPDNAEGQMATVQSALALLDMMPVWT